MSLSAALKDAQKSHRAWISGAVEGICARDGCTRDELAEALGVARSTVWTWCEAVAMPRMDTWFRLRALIEGRAVVRGGRLRAAGE